MKKNRVTRRDVLFLSISMFLIVSVWVGLSIYHSWVTSTISEDLQLQITPIASKFDLTTIDKLKTRQQVVPTFAKADQSSESAQITPTPSITLEEITPSVEPEPTTTLDEGNLIEEPIPTP